MRNKLLYILFLFAIFFIVSCTSSIKINSCNINDDCSSSQDCIEGACVDFQYCVDDFDCENQRCINGKCKSVECVVDKDCNDKKCVDFLCTDIEKQLIGSTCYNYGNEECLSGVCITDEIASYCSDTCIDDNQCPSDMNCSGSGVKYCHYGTSSGGDQNGGYGSNCIINGQSDCAESLTCVKNIYNRGKDRCLKTCANDRECYLGYRCVFHEDRAYCTPPKYRSEGELCVKYDGLECKKDSNSCVNLIGNDKYCTQICKDDTDCSEGNICKEFKSGNYCIKPSSSTFGERCDQSSSLQCIEGLICDWQYYQALCTKECSIDQDCGNYYSCSVTYSGEKYCRPAPNNLGDRSGELGESCFEHGDSDCKANMLCLAGSTNNKNAYCTYHCEQDSDCSGDFYCSDPTRTGNKLCVKGPKGKLGSSCINNGCEDGLFCYLKSGRDLTAFCTNYCDNHNEACEREGYYCNDVYRGIYLCTESEPTEPISGNLGDKCPTGSCNSGLNCIFDVDGNFCSQMCDTECPDGFTCLDYDENNKFCYKN